MEELKPGPPLYCSYIGRAPLMPVQFEPPGLPARMTGFTVSSGRLPADCLHAGSGTEIVICNDLAAECALPSAPRSAAEHAGPHGGQTALANEVSCPGAQRTFRIGGHIIPIRTLDPDITSTPTGARSFSWPAHLRPRACASRPDSPLISCGQIERPLGPLLRDWALAGTAEQSTLCRIDIHQPMIGNE